MSHGIGKRIDVTAPHSRSYQGPFGRLCPDLPPWQIEGKSDAELDADFLAFANSHMLERPNLDPAELANAATVAELDDEFSTGKSDDATTGIPAGYTYFGQFVDHDITFDPVSTLMRQSDPNALLNFRTPRLDLDNIYGRGPHDQPYMYDGETGKMLLGTVAGTGFSDLPRHNGRALIGDMRNDENNIVCQLQIAFLRAHNTLVDRATAQNMDDPFTAAQTTLRWLYQWVVWNDFLRRVCIDSVMDCALQLSEVCDGRKKWELGLKDVYHWKEQPFMPVEFAVAAYRFGHSMVRNAYQTNAVFRAFPEFVPLFAPGGGANSDLRGFEPLSKENLIQWDWFLNMKSSRHPFPQRARKIDTKLANALAHLGGGASSDPANVLAARNLKRGLLMGLPTGGDIARKWCLTPVPIAEDEPDSLWFYILKEAGSLRGANAGQMLGRLGSTIVAATFAGLLKGDPHSYLNLWPCWTPNDDPLLRPGHDNFDSKDANTWELSSIIRLAGVPVSAGHISDPDTIGDELPAVAN